MVDKKLHRLVLTDDELALFKGGVSEIRAQVFAKLKDVSQGDEHDFYRRRMDECDALLTKIDGVLIADTSQDAGPDEDEIDEGPP